MREQASQMVQHLIRWMFLVSRGGWGILLTISRRFSHNSQRAWTNVSLEISRMLEFLGSGRRCSQARRAMSAPRASTTFWTSARGRYYLSPAQAVQNSSKVDRRTEDWTQMRLMVRLSDSITVLSMGSRES